jgi:hypothetical protein
MDQNQINHNTNKAKLMKVLNKKCIAKQSLNIQSMLNNQRK